MGLQRVGHSWETELNSEAEGECKESVPQPIFPEYLWRLISVHPEPEACPQAEAPGLANFPL